MFRGENVISATFKWLSKNNCARVYMRMCCGEEKGWEERRKGGKEIGNKFNK